MLKLATGPLHVVIRRREGYPALDSDPHRLAPPLGVIDGQAYPSLTLARRP